MCDVAHPIFHFEVTKHAVWITAEELVIPADQVFALKITKNISFGSNQGEGCEPDGDEVRLVSDSAGRFPLQSNTSNIGGCSGL